MPFTFTDRKGQEWDVSMTLLSAKRIDASDFTELTAQKVSILDPPQEYFMEMMTNSPLLFGMMWAVVKPQADALSITEDEFLDRMDGRTITDGREAFWGSLSDFFHDRATALSKLLETLKSANQRVKENFNLLTEKTQEMLKTQIDKEFQKVTTELESLGTDSTPSLLS